MRVKLRGKVLTHQHRLIYSTAQFPALVGGYGSGKSEGLILRTIRQKYLYPNLNCAYYLPTYDLVKKIAYPRFEELLVKAKIPYKLNRQDAELILPNKGKIIFRTMDRPERIVGYEVADSVIDELDTLPKDKAKDVFQRVLARNRQKKADGKPNTIAVGTTPEGFRFVYDRWYKNRSDGYELIQAKTADNPFLPPDYIPNLMEQYPPQLLAAYLEGQFVNLTTGSVYPAFDRVLNHSDEVIAPDDALHIGMDFNVGRMCAIVHVLRGGLPHAVAEIIGAADTPAMIRIIKDRYPNHRIIIYPDAAGGSRKTQDASSSDIQLLKNAGFRIDAPAANPPVKDRIAAMNAMFLNANGERRYKINTDACPEYTAALEQQAYDKSGQPDKLHNLDHPNDAAGYFIHRKYPIIRRQIGSGEYIS